MTGQVLVGPKAIGTDCNCRRCWEANKPPPGPWGFTSRPFIVCATCGNKRCPHATDHRNACTGSNEVGQVGSDYA